MITHQDVVDTIQETITELSSACRKAIGLNDVFGSSDGWYVIDYKGFEREDALELEPDYEGDTQTATDSLGLDRWQDRTPAHR